MIRTKISRNSRKYHCTRKGSCSIVNKTYDAEDAVRNASIRIAENIENINGVVCPKIQDFVVTIVGDKAINAYRLKNRKETSEYIDHRQIILLKYYHGYNNREISKRIDLTEVNVMNLIREPKKLLQVCKEEGVL